MRRWLGVLAAVLAVLTGAAPAAAAPGPPDAPQWWFDSWHVAQVWNAGARGQGVVIGEIDTGVNASLPELSGRILPGRDFGPDGGNGWVDRDSDEFGHGTAMASIMVARPGAFGVTGLAPDARILPVAIPISGTTDAAADDRLASGIDWAVDHGAKIITMSIGGPRDPAQVDDPCPQSEQEAILHAVAKGVIVFAAAGNGGAGANPVDEPGVCLGVVAVGAVDRSGDVADFSARRSYVAFTAPGVNVASLSRVAGAAYSGNGTSQATALAAAAAALVWSRYPALSGPQVLARIFATLADRTVSQDLARGYGTLDAYAAVTAAVPETAADPVTTAAAPFVARVTAFATSQGRPAAPPAATPGTATGRFGIGARPSRITPTVIAGGAVAAAGLLALVLLFVLRGRRRPATSEELAAAEPPGSAH